MVKTSNPMQQTVDIVTTQQILLGVGIAGILVLTLIIVAGRKLDK